MDHPPRFKLIAKSQKLRARLVFLRRQRQSEDGNHSLPGDVHLCFPRRWQIEGLAVFATVDFGVWAPGLFDVSTLALDHVFHVEPALQVSAAELSLGIFLVAGA